MSPAPQRQRPGTSSPIRGGRLTPHVEPITAAQTPEVASTPEVSDSAPAESLAPAVAASGAVMRESAQKRRKIRDNISVFEDLKEAAKVAVLVAGAQGGPSTWTAIVNIGVERYLEELAEQYNGGQPWPTDAGVRLPPGPRMSRPGADGS